MTGRLSVLNVGVGDIKVSFNQANKPESAKAVRMLIDMRDRGYAIMVELPDGSYTRAVDIDASRGRYVVVVPDDAQAQALPQAEPVTCACGCGGTVAPGTKWKRGHARKGRRGPRRVSVPAESVNATGIARSAGG